MSGKRKEILKDAGIYAASSYIAQGFDFLNGILFRRFLGPESMGIWSFLQVIQNYAKHSSLGITTATSRDIPYYRQKGEIQKMEEVKNLVFSFTVLTSLITSAGLAAFALIARKQYSPEIFVGLLALSGIVLAQRVYNLFIAYLRSLKEFAFVGILNIVSSALSVVLTLILTWNFKFYGFLAANILNYIFIVTAIEFFKPCGFRFFLSWKPLKAILSLGTIILIADLLRTIVVSLDRMIIAKFLGFHELGIYSVALMADNYLFMLPNMMGVILFPHFQEALAKRDSVKDLEKYLLEPLWALSGFFPFIIGAVWFASDWLVPIVLPQYVEGIFALKILAVGSIFLAMTHSFNTFLITVRKHSFLIPINLIAIVVGLGLNFCFLQMKWGIEGVALAETILSFVYFLLLSAPCLKMLFPFKKIIKIYLQFFFGVCYWVIGFFAIETFFQFMTPSFVKTLIQGLCVLLVLLPLAFWTDRKSGLIDSLKAFTTRGKNPRKSE